MAEKFVGYLIMLLLLIVICACLFAAINLSVIFLFAAMPFIAMVNIMRQELKL